MPVLIGIPDAVCRESVEVTPNVSMDAEIINVGKVILYIVLVVKGQEDDVKVITTQGNDNADGSYIKGTVDVTLLGLFTIKGN